MSDELQPAIAALERKLAALEQQANGIRSAINVLCETGGMPPRYPDGGGGGGRPSVDGALAQIGPDTFYGKKQSTAIRQYLEMRKAAGKGPATPREIFDALKKGGMQFETKSDDVALVGLRALLRKNTVTFHKLPNGSYGLLSWYPDAKKPKAAPGDMIGKTDDTDEDADDTSADDASDDEVDHADVA
jgi:hypothetical protein